MESIQEVVSERLHSEETLQSCINVACISQVRYAVDAPVVLSVLQIDIFRVSVHIHLVIDLFVVFLEVRASEYGQIGAVDGIFLK